MSDTIQLDRDYYYFSLWLIYTFLLALLFLWALFIPQSEEQVSQLVDTRLLKDILLVLVDVLPGKNWILYLCCLILMGMMFSYIGLVIYNEDVLTVSTTSLNTITDEHAKPLIEEDRTKFLKDFAYDETSGIYDLPITDVSEIMYEDRYDFVR